MGKFFPSHQTRHAHRELKDHRTLLPLLLCRLLAKCRDNRPCWGILTAFRLIGDSVTRCRLVMLLNLLPNDFPACNRWIVLLDIAED